MPSRFPGWLWQSHYVPFSSAWWAHRPLKVLRIEELDFWYGNLHVDPFLYILGPAPNLNVLRVRDEARSLGGEDRPRSRPILSDMFRGCLPSLCELHLEVLVTWFAGSLNGHGSLELGSDADDTFDLALVLVALQKTPLLGNFRLVGRCVLSNYKKPPTVALPSLRNCTLIGHKPPSLIWTWTSLHLQTSLSLSHHSSTPVTG